MKKLLNLIHAAGLDIRMDDCRYGDSIIVYSSALEAVETRDDETVAAVERVMLDLMQSDDFKSALRDAGLRVCNQVYTAVHFRINPPNSGHLLPDDRRMCIAASRGEFDSLEDVDDAVAAIAEELDAAFDCAARLEHAAIAAGKTANFTHGELAELQLAVAHLRAFRASLEAF